MKTSSLKVMLLLCISVSVISCKKNNNEQVVAKKRHILVNEYNNSTNIASARYYVNNVAKTLGNSSAEKIYGEDLEVDGSDVYVLASRQLISGGGLSAVIYKNGVEMQSFPLPSGVYYNCLSVKGNDVYLAGTEYPSGGVPKILFWKNGAVTSITTNTGSQATDARPYDLLGIGNDVYIAGTEQEFTPPYNRLPKYWKNGNPVVLSTSTNSSGSAHRIVISGSDVFCSGEENNKPVFWKNGTKTALSTANGWCYGLAVSGNDVYVAGSVATGNNVYNVASWKNGTQTMLSNTTEGTVTTYGIGLDGDDVYVIGSMPLSTGAVPVYWKNGVINEFPSSAGTNAYAYRLVIK